MSAAVQELYTGVPVPLPPEFPAEPDPSAALVAKPEAPAFVLSCSGVPSEPQRTHGLKICPQESAERRDFASRESCHAVMDVLSEAPAGIGKFVKGGEMQNSSLVKLGTFQSSLREDALAAKGRKDLAKQQFMQHSLTSEGTSWPEGKEPPLVSSPSHIERKGARQNLEENQAKVQVATEKQSDLMEEAQGTQAKGPRLCGKTGEHRTRVSAAVPPEGRQSSGVDAVAAKAAVSGTGSLVSLEPISHATVKEEEERCNRLSASPRPAGEEKLPKQGEERHAVFDNNSSVQLGHCRFALPSERRSIVNAYLLSSSFEASSDAFQGSSKCGPRPWCVSRNLLEVDPVVQEEFPFRKEEILKSNLSCEEVELQEEWDSEPEMAEAFSHTGKNEGDDAKEQKETDAHGFSFARGRTVEIQKGSALHSCREEDQNFHLEHGRFQTPIEQLTTSVIMPSGTSVHDAAHAWFGKPLEGSSGAPGIQADTFCFLRHGRLAVMAAENWTPLLKGKDFLCLQDNPHSLNHSSLKAESGGLAGSRDFARVVRPRHSSRGADIGVLADKGSLRMLCLWDEFLLPQQAGPCFAWRGSIDILPPSRVPVVPHTGRLLCLKKPFASSRKSGSCAAMNDAWQRAAPTPRGRKPGSRTPRRSSPDLWHGNELLEGSRLPAAPALVLGSDPGASQQNATGGDALRNKGSALTGSPLKAESLKWQRANMLSGYSFPSDLLKPNCFGQDPALGVKGDGLNSACELVVKSPPEKFSFKNRLLSISSSPNQTFLQLGPLSSATLKGQKSMEKIYVKLSEGREIPNLTCVGCSSRPAQDQKILSQKWDVLISPFLKAYSSFAREQFPGTGLFAQGTNHHSSLLALEVKNAGIPLRQDVLISISSEQNLGDAQGEDGLIAGMTELPFTIFFNSKEALEALLENVMFPGRGRKVTFSFQGAERTRLPPICLSRNILEFDSSEARDSSELTVLKWHTENVSYALQTEHLFCRGTAAEIVGGSITFPSLKGEVSGTFSRFLGGTESRLLEAESRQELAGGQEEPLEGHLVGQGIRAPFEERRVSDTRAHLSLQKEAEQKPAAPCDSLSQEWGARAKPKVKSPLKRRHFGDGHPSSCISQGSAASREDPQPQPLALGGRVVQEEEESPCHAAREFKRPKRGGGEGLCFGRLDGRNATAVASLCTLPRGEGCRQRGYPGAVGRSCRARRPLAPFWKESVRACTEVSALNPFRASETVPGSPSLRNPIETVPRQTCTLRDSATKPAAPPIHEALLWDRPAERQGSPSHLLDSAWPQHRAHEACLRMLSALADKLSAIPQNCKPLSRSGDLLPSAEKCSQWRRRKLLETVSFVTLKLNSNLWHSRGSYSFKMAGSPASEESRVLCCFDLSSANPSAPSSPVVHLRADARLPRKLVGRGPQRTAPRPPLQTSERRLSSCPSVWDAAASPPKLWATLSSEGRCAIARTPGCPARGPCTMLALFPHGCYRLWTRRRISARPKVTLLQLAQGLKGLKRAPWVSADLSSSLRCSLGWGLSVRDQHSGPSATPSEFPPLHSKPCQWQPASPASASVGHGNRTYLAKSSTKPPLVPDPRSDPPRARNNDDLRLEPFLSASSAKPRPDPDPAPAPAPLGLPAPGPEDKHDASDLTLPRAETQLAKDESEKRPKKVSQIRIRKTIPKPDPNLTPMGLPRQKRLKKTEFSLEEIYTNKNYKSPPATRCLETIFEEPKEKNGSLISVSQQKRKRVLEFQDFTIPRKRKARSRLKGTGSSTRAQKAALGGRELDLLLVQKLTDLETFFAKEEKQELTTGS